MNPTGSPSCPPESGPAIRMVSGNEVLGEYHLRCVGRHSLDGGWVFRSSELDEMTDADARWLYDRLGIRSIYDIRSSSETATRTDPVILGVRTVTLAPAQTRRRDASSRLVAGVIGEYGEPGERMRGNYRRYAHEFPLLGKALRSISHEPFPILVHCTNGKDRSGVLCATLLHIAGFPLGDIMDDYLLANEVNARSIAVEEKRLSPGMTGREHEILMSFLTARPDYLQAFFEEAASLYGDFDGYVEQGLHIDPVMREAIASRF